MMDDDTPTIEVVSTSVLDFRDARFTLITSIWPRAADSYEILSISSLPLNDNCDTANTVCKEINEAEIL